jgi:hypothetical protein
MAITAHSGPLVVFGGIPASASTSPDYNSDRGPSLFDQGTGLMDPRVPYMYKPGIGADEPVYGFLMGNFIKAINQVPSTIAAANLAASQTPVAGTALTLVSSTGAGITVGVSITRADTGATVTGLRAIDGAVTQVKFGSGPAGTGGPVWLWNPATMIARAVSITSAGDDSAATFTVRGYDIYGYPMTETIPGANTTIARGAKAFKYIVSITPAGTLAGAAVTAGVTDIIGLPIRADYVSETQISMADTWITASTGFTAAVTTTATATTGDVRGTYALQTASNNTRRLAITVSPSVANISSSSGLFGVTQYSDF